MICIYEIVNIVNQKRYVGQTINFKSRVRHHLYVMRHGIEHNRHLQSAWNKYGAQSFEFYVLEECVVDRLNECEQLWHDYYRSLNLLYNGRFVVCSNRGVKRVPMSVEQRVATGNAARGRIWSLEQRERHSVVMQGHKGRCFSVEDRIKVSLFWRGRKRLPRTKEHQDRLNTSRLGIRYAH